MIKRRFYKHEHDDKNDPSDSSSSSDSELEAEDVVESEDGAVTQVKEDAESEESEDDAVAEAEEDSESEESHDAVAEVKEDAESSSTSSGELVNEDGDETESGDETNERDSEPLNVPPCILQRKKVFRCKICPKVVCLSEDFLMAHLKSKKHARSEKLLNEGRLKSILNDDLEIENQETPAELHARIMALGQNNPKKKSKGRQRQRKRSARKKKTGDDDSTVEKARVSTKSPAKKRRKSEN